MRGKAFNEMNDAMKIEKVSANFKITGPHGSERKTNGIYLNKQDLLYIFTPLNEPFTDISQNTQLETDPKEWETVHIIDKFLPTHPVTMHPLK